MAKINIPQKDRNIIGNVFYRIALLKMNSKHVTHEKLRQTLNEFYEMRKNYNQKDLNDYLKTLDEWRLRKGFKTVNNIFAEVSVILNEKLPPFILDDADTFEVPVEDYDPPPEEDEDLPPEPEDCPPEEDIDLPPESDNDDYDPPPEM